MQFYHEEVRISSDPTLAPSVSVENLFRFTNSSSLSFATFFQVRSTMLPTWVLAPNALQLAVQLCPNAISIRLRYDNSTPNDVIAPLMTLEKIKEFSAVCVSSGERVLLDFTDMSSIFQKYGPLGLSFLELKV